MYGNENMIVCSETELYTAQMRCECSPSPPGSLYTMVLLHAVGDSGGKVEECTSFTVARSYRVKMRVESGRFSLQITVA